MSEKTASLSIKRSEVNGDVIAGNKILNIPPKTSLETAIQAIREKMDETEELTEFIKELTELTSMRKRKIVGLENKLKKGSRHDLIDDAIYFKNQFEQKLARNQMFESEQKVLVQALAYICTSFNRKVLPMIREERSISDIDSAINSEIVEETHKAIVQYNEVYTSQMVEGMLYYLTGKCHILWS